MTREFLIESKRILREKGSHPSERGRKNSKVAGQTEEKARKKKGMRKPGRKKNPRISPSELQAGKLHFVKRSGRKLDNRRKGN